MIRLLATLIGLACFLPAVGCSTPARLEPADIDRLTGAPWVGTLTYLDYGSGQSTTIDSSLMVRRTADNPAAWEIGTGYSKEPHADSKKTMVLTHGGHMLSDERVVSRELLPTGDLVFVTEVEGEDDNRPALFRFESAITPHEYTRRKMVRLEDGSGDGKFFQRHVYRWRR